MRFKTVLHNVLLLCLTCFIQAADANKKSFYEMTNHEIDKKIQEIAEKRLSITQKMNLFSEMFLGTSYNLTCTGDGPYALLENYIARNTLWLAQK